MTCWFTGCKGEKLKSFFYSFYTLVSWFCLMRNTCSCMVEHTCSLSRSLQPWCTLIVFSSFPLKNLSFEKVSINIYDSAFLCCLLIRLENSLFVFWNYDTFLLWLDTCLLLPLPCWPLEWKLNSCPEILIRDVLQKDI